jgi:hypothetical protein
MLAKPNFVTKARSVFRWVVAIMLLLAVTAGEKRRTLADSPAPPSTSPLDIHYTLEVPGGGEIFPALASSAPAQYWPMATLTVTNNSPHAITETVSAEVPDWTRESVETFSLEPNEKRSLSINPELLPQAFTNTEIRPATLAVRATILGSSADYDETRPVYLHSASDIFWGPNFVNAQSIARWVTPHDPAVLQLVSSARKYVTRGRLAGYKLASAGPATAIAAQVEDEARAVFSAMQQLGLSYVDSISTYGKFAARSERVRLPSETLSMSTANCIDMSVAFASAMENLGLDPVIVLVPGHAFTGVRLGPNSSDVLYLDLTVMPDGSFDSAYKRALGWLQKTPKNSINIIDIATARSHQIYPMPEPLAPVPVLAQKA